MICRLLLTAFGTPCGSRCIMFLFSSGGAVDSGRLAADGRAPDQSSAHGAPGSPHLRGGKPPADLGESGPGGHWMRSPRVVVGMSRKGIPLKFIKGSHRRGGGVSPSFENEQGWVNVGIGAKKRPLAVNLETWSRLNLVFTSIPTLMSTKGFRIEGSCYASILLLALEKWARVIFSDCPAPKATMSSFMNGEQAGRGEVRRPTPSP